MLPWTDTTTLDQRRAFIAAWTAGHDSVAGVARRFRISRKALGTETFFCDPA